MKKVVFVPIFAFLAACAIIPDFFSDRPPERNPLKASEVYTLKPYEYQRTLYLGEKTIEQKNYEFNRREYVRAGESVLRVKTFRQNSYKNFYNEFMLDHAITLKFGVENFTIPAGPRHILGSVDIDGDVYYVLDSTDKYHMLMTPDFYLSNLALYEKSPGVFPGFIGKPFLNVSLTKDNLLHNCISSQKTSFFDRELYPVNTAAFPFPVTFQKRGFSS